MNRMDATLKTARESHWACKILKMPPILNVSCFVLLTVRKSHEDQAGGGVEAAIVGCPMWHWLLGAGILRSLI